MKKLIIFFLLICIVVTKSNSKIVSDSLLANIAEPDTTIRIALFLGLAEQELNTAPSISLVYANEALILSGIIRNDTLQARSYFQVGLSQYRLNKYDEAIPNFNECLRLAKLKTDLPLAALTLNRLGNAYQLKGDYYKALDKYTEARKINHLVGDKVEIARSVTNIGSIYRIYGNYDKAIGMHLDALGIYDEIDHQDGLAWTSLNIARLFKQMGNYSKALEYAQKSFANYEEIEAETGVLTGVILALKEKAAIYTLTGEFDKALDFSSQVLKMNKDANNKFGVANSYNSIGKIYFEKSEYGIASEYFDKALKTKEELNNLVDVASILRFQGKILMISGDYTTSLIKVEKSLRIAKNQNLKEDIKEGYKSLSEIYSKIGKYKKSLQYTQLYAALKDSLNSQKINELELQYDFDRQQRVAEFEQKQHDADQQARLQRQKIYTYAAIGGVVFLALIAILIFRSYQRKKKTNEILRQQKREIETQRDEIEAQRDLATNQRDQIARQNEIITDSIEYARRIQSALLPQPDFINQLLPDHFIFYLPKNIVSGDFYWVSQIKDKIIITVADCTGHGVPGAFMSMLGVSLLNEIVNKNHVLEPHKILTNMKEGVIAALHQEHGYQGSKDGMDMALAVIDKKKKKLKFTGAYNPVYIVRDNELIEHKGEKMPIGIHSVRVKKEFKTQEIDIMDGDMFYMFSDGYLDQFGGPDGLKFRQKPFKDLILNLKDKPLTEQKEVIEKTFFNWKGERPQLDDILVMGFKVM